MTESAYVTSFAEVEREIPSSRVRHAILTLLSAAARFRGGFARLSAIPRVHFINMHHVFDDEVDSFRKFVAFLASEHKFITYSEAVERVLQGRVDAPYVVFTYDDGFRSCLQAAEVLNEFGAHAIFFVCGTTVGEKDPSRLAFHCREILKMPPIEHLDWDDVDNLLLQGHEIGSHTMTHPNLANASPSHIQDELQDSFELFQQRLGSVAHFAWPYGTFGHFSAVAARVVFEAGYTSCASGVRGCHGGEAFDDPRRLCVYRENMVAKWPLAHCLYFLSRSASRPFCASNLWPSGWEAEILAGPLRS